MSLHLYLTVEERHLGPISLKYLSKIVNKKEVTGNDSTRGFKVTLRANNIKEDPENGKYIEGCF